MINNLSNLQFSPFPRSIGSIVYPNGNMQNRIYIQQTYTTLLHKLDQQIEVKLGQVGILQLHSMDDPWFGNSISPRFSLSTRLGILLILFDNLY